MLVAVPAVFIALSVALGSAVAAGGQFGFDVREALAELLLNARGRSRCRWARLTLLRATALVLDLRGLERHRGSSLACKDCGAVATEMADERVGVGFSDKVGVCGLAEG